MDIETITPIIITVIFGVPIIIALMSKGEAYSDYKSWLSDDRKIGFWKLIKNRVELLKFRSWIKPFGYLLVAIVYLSLHLLAAYATGYLVLSLLAAPMRFLVWLLFEPVERKDTP